MKSLMNTFIKSSKSPVSHRDSAKKSFNNALKTVTSRSYTGLKDYVYHISQGNIDGVDPKVVQECPVCSKIYKEMFGTTDAPLLDNKDVLVPQKIWIALWILYHDSSMFDEITHTNTDDGYNYIT